MTQNRNFWLIICSLWPFRVVIFDQFGGLKSRSLDFISAVFRYIRSVEALFLVLKGLLLDVIKAQKVDK